MFDIVMALQYNLPLSTTPLPDLAEKIGLKYEDFEKEVKKLAENRVLKRYGANMNYRAFSKKAALVGFRMDASKASRINEVGDVKHNFLRDAEYNVWFTIKGKDLDELLGIVKALAYELKAEDFVFLPTKKIYKMDVKYDLLKGVSWSYLVEPEKVMLISELGLDEEIKKLEALPIERRPFLKLGFNEEEAVSLIEELIKKGVVRDFCGVLNEAGIGFKDNGMVVLKTEKPEKVARRLLGYPQITHLIERISCEKWNYPIYFMLHARSREKIENIVSEISKLPEILDFRIVYSKANLKP